MKNWCICITITIFICNAFVTAQATVVDDESIRKAIMANKSGEDAFRSEKIELSIDFFLKAINYNPNFEQAYSNLGLAYMKLNRSSEAIDANRNAIELATGTNMNIVRAGSYYNIGKIYEAKGLLTDAHQSYEAALKHNNNQVYAKAIKRIAEKLKTSHAQRIALNENIPASNQTVQPDIGLEVYYDFEDDFQSAGIVSDKSGNGNHIKVIGKPEQVRDSVLGNVISFKSHASLRMGKNPTKGFKVITVSLLFKTHTPSENFKLAGTAWWDGGPGSGWLFGTHYPELWAQNTSSIRLSSVNWEDVTHCFISNEWNHAVLSYDGNRMREYINGKEVVNHPTSGEIIGDGSGIFEIARWSPFGFDFTGFMDEFRIYSKVLSQDEVTGLSKYRFGKVKDINGDD